MVRLGHGADGEIENSFATDQHGGVYIATDRKLYRFVAGRGGGRGSPGRSAIPTATSHKPGQVDDGTGTTPDRDAGRLRQHHRQRRPDGRRRVPHAGSSCTHGRCGCAMVCKVPVFTQAARAPTENSLIAAGRSMIVENNYGYKGPTSVDRRQLTAPGFARIDINRDGTGCRLVWTQHDRARPDRRPEAVARRNGLIYTYTKDPGAIGSLVLDRAGLPHRPRRLQAVRREPASATTTTTPGSRSAAARTAVPRDARWDHRPLRIGS